MTTNARFKDYSYFDRKYQNQFNRRLINGKVTGCGNCVGYCQYANHSGFLTAALRQKHNCIEKGCHYYLQKPEHRKTERAADVSKAIVKKSSNAIASLEGIKIMGAEETNSGEWKLKYITVTNDYSIADLEKIISLALEITVSLERINCDFDTAVQLLYS